MSFAGTASPNPNGITTKRKREAPNFAAASAAEKPMTGSSTLARIQEAEIYLKKQPGVEKTLEDIIGYLSIQHGNPRELKQFEWVLKNTITKMAWNPEGLGGKGSFKYRSIIPAENREQLKAYLQQRTDSIGIKYNDILDGWPRGVEVLAQMSHDHEVMIWKNKKEELRAVWQDDPTMHHIMAVDLQIAWNNIVLPANADDVRSKLLEAGLKPTSAPRQVVKGTIENKRKKGPRKGGKTTNTHIAHLLKDYSSKRK